MVTLREVARLAGVSVTTVSHTLNKTRFVQPETAERVFAAVKELGYSPNCIARGLRTGSSRTIGVVAPSALDPFFAEVVIGIEETCFERGYEVYLGFVEYPEGLLIGEEDGNGDTERAREDDFLEAILAGDFSVPPPEVKDDFEGSEKEKAVIDKLIAREVDGLILNLGRSDETLARELAGRKQKLAIFHRAIPGIDGDSFMSDDYQGLSAALDRLIELGHRRIGMVYGFSWASHAVRARFRAYREALQRAGITLERRYLANGGYTLDGGEGATRRLLSIPDPPTAIVYWSDYMAIAGMDVARQCSVPVPDGLSVVGYDDLAISSRINPRLSSVRQESYEIGAKMAQRLIDRIEGEFEGSYERIILPTAYVERESVASPRPA